MSTRPKGDRPVNKQDSSEHKLDLGGWEDSFSALEMDLGNESQPNHLADESEVNTGVELLPPGGYNEDIDTGSSALENLEAPSSPLTTSSSLEQDAAAAEKAIAEEEQPKTPVSPTDELPSEPDRRPDFSFVTTDEVDIAGADFSSLPTRNSSAAADSPLYQRPTAQDASPAASIPPAPINSAIAEPTPQGLRVRNPSFEGDAVPDLPPPAIDALPLEGPPPTGNNTWLTNYQLFKAESTKLARQGQWRKLAAISAHVLLHAPYAKRLTRTGILLDLARIYRDRLADEAHAEEAFAILAAENPASPEALTFLRECYEKRGAWGTIFDLLFAAVEATWDPADRLNWTKEAASMATEKLNDLSLAIKAWEHLWKLGDAVEEAANELSRLYRLAQRWPDLASFLQQQAEMLEGSGKLVILRELAEVRLSGMQDADGASKILEQIVELRPQDPIAVLQLARVNTQRRDWLGLVRLGRKIATQDFEGALDLQHIVAGALWEADRWEESIEAYDRILKVNPDDYDGTTRKEQYLERAEKYEELLNLLLHKIETTADKNQQATLLSRTATLASDQLKDALRSAQLWERRLLIDAEHLPTYEALFTLYEKTGNQLGMAKALEGQLAVCKVPSKRLELLKRLGQHSSTKLNDDERAENCWKEILSIDPTDEVAREELIKLHERRKDYESLNNALLRQIWLSTDLVHAQKLCRLAATNLDKNFDAPERSIEAWRRLLDYAPVDAEALAALSRHYSKLERHRELITVLEQEIRTGAELPRKIEQAMKVASLWLLEKEDKSAAAVFESILRWMPLHKPALDGLLEIYCRNGQQGKALGVLEHASALEPDLHRRIELLKRCLDLMPAEEHQRRFFHLRRLLWLSGGNEQIFNMLQQEAEAGSLWSDLLLVYTLRCMQENNAARRLEWQQEMARLLEKRLNDKGRAYLAWQGMLLSPENFVALEDEILRVAGVTRRHEDLLVILDRLTGVDFDLTRRKTMLLKRAEICEKSIKDQRRAFQEYQRLLFIDPADQKVLTELERLAAEKQLWPDLLAVYAELGDLANTPAQRMELITKREQIAREKLNNRAMAFDLLIQKFRLDAQDLDLLRALTEDAEALKGWDWFLPILQATQLFNTGEHAASELAIIAALYEEKLQDAGVALSLYSSAFVINPEGTNLVDKLENLAQKTNSFTTLDETFRMAAALTPNKNFAVELLRRLAVINEEKLEQPARAIDIHRRLLALQTDERHSLEVLIEWHRSRKEWRDLRDRLRQWISITPETDKHLSPLLEIAQISEQNLNEPEIALQTYGEILGLDAKHATARHAVDKLVGKITEPLLKLRWLQAELRALPPEKSLPLRLEIATLQEVELRDISGAIATLSEVTSDEQNQVFAQKHRLFKQNNQWRDLVCLLRSQADKEPDGLMKQTMLDEAVGILHKHLENSEEQLREEIYRAVLHLRPTDFDIRIRLAQMLRRNSRFEDLSVLLRDNLHYQKNKEDQIDTLNELARIQAHNLKDKLEAAKTWQQILELAPNTEGTILALAFYNLEQGEIGEYLALREKQAHLLPAHLAAIIYCHLAEICDESEGFADRIVGYYREARKIDPNNMPAMEALKGIGRRLKNLRPAAALLPLEGERDLTTAERAIRLKALGDQMKVTDAQQALEWYQRGIAINPQEPSLWEAIIDLLGKDGDRQIHYWACNNLLSAVERTTPEREDRLVNFAQLTYQTSLAAREIGQEAVYARLISYTHRLTPQYPPTTLAMAQMLIERKDMAGAHRLLDRLITEHAPELSAEQKMQAHFYRGLTFRHQGQTDQAIDDLRQSLRIKPLQAQALITMGELQAASGRMAAAIEHYLRALTIVEDAHERGRLYYQLGVLWEDHLHETKEAGACYELSLSEGFSERELLHRTLRHFQRIGQIDRCLAVVDGLLASAQEPEELSTLWVVRGEVFAAREGQEQQAIEAFDMALSYDPARADARLGLTQILEKRQDWPQLIQVLEAGVDVGTPQQQSQTLLRLANICGNQLRDAARGEAYLRQAVSVYPTKEALEILEQLYSLESGRLEERREVLGLLTNFGPPWYSRVEEIGKLVLAENKAWAWCLFSPLLGVSQIDAEIKNIVQTMRKEYEKVPLLTPAIENLPILRHPLDDQPLTAVLAELGENLKEWGNTQIDQTAGEGGAVIVAENTSLGKTFAAIASALEISGVGLYRAQHLPTGIAFVNSEPRPAVIIRTEIIQQLVHAEVGFLFSYALELSRPGHRLLAVASPEERPIMLPALWKTLGWSNKTSPAIDRLAERIMEASSPEQRGEWAQRLAHLQQEDPQDFGRLYWKGLNFTGRRLGLIAGADLRQAFRVISRIEPEAPRPKVVAKIEELDEFIGGSELYQDVIAFASSSVFGHILQTAKAPL